MSNAIKKKAKMKQIVVLDITYNGTANEVIEKIKNANLIGDIANLGKVNHELLISFAPLFINDGKQSIIFSNKADSEKVILRQAFEIIYKGKVEKSFYITPNDLENITFSGYSVSIYNSDIEDLISELNQLPNYEKVY